MKWVLNLFKKNENLRVGSVVRTKLGIGTVVGGSLHIKYDHIIFDQQPNNRTKSHNLDEISE